MVKVEVSAVNSRDQHFDDLGMHRPLQGFVPGGQPNSSVTANEGVGLYVRHKQKVSKIAIRQTNKLFSFLKVDFTI